MTKTEMQYINNHLKNQSNKHHGKRYELFQIIRGKRDATKTDILNKLDKTMSSAAFCNLKNRLKNNILDLLFVCRIRNKRYDSSLERIIQCLRYKFRGLELVSKSVFVDAAECLHLARDIAIRSDFIYELRDIEHLIINYLPAHLHDLEVDTCGNLMSVERLKDLYAEIKTAGIQLDNVLFQQVVRSYKENKSVRVQYWANKLLYQYYYSNGNFFEAFYFAKELDFMLERNHDLFSKQQHSEVKLMLIKCSFQLDNYSEAISHLRKFAFSIDNNSSEYWESFFLLFRAYVLSYQLNEAGKMLIQMESAHSQDQAMRAGLKSDFLMDWNYYKIYLMFLSEDYEEANLCIEKQICHVKNGSTLSYYFRLLELYVLLKRKKTELFEYRLESLHEALKTNRDLNLIRIRWVCRYLKCLVSTNYCGQSAEQKFWKSIAKYPIELDDWNPFSYELVDFDRLVSHFRPEYGVQDKFIAMDAFKNVS
ncbi:MAG: hypothetical protein MI922_24345 [Bacteroidales bacterium]|nr:hypothetical protein [Bacteroidales bacterium]